MAMSWKKVRCGCGCRFEGWPSGTCAANVQLKSDIGLNKFGTIELWEYQFMWNSLIAAVVFGGFLAETAVPVIAAAQTQKQATEPAAPMTAPPQMKKQTTEPAAPATVAPQTQKKQIQRTNPRSGSSPRRNVARGAVVGAAGGAILGGGRGAAAGAVLGGTAGSLSRRGRRR